VRSDDVEPDDPSWLDSFGNWQDLARVVIGNPVNVIETSRHELHALARTRSLWRTIVDDAITLVGEKPSQIVAPVRDRARIVSQAVESSPAGRLSDRKPAVRTAKTNRAGSDGTSVRAGGLRANRGDAGGAESDCVNAEADKASWGDSAPGSGSTRELPPSEAPKYLSKARRVP